MHEFARAGFLPSPSQSGIVVAMLTSPSQSVGWTIFSNHGHVLIFIAGHPDARIRDVANAVGITERRAQGIVKELSDGGFLIVNKSGRRNTYRLNPDQRLRHPIEAQHKIGELLQLFVDEQNES